MKEQFDVIIIGAGIVGSTVARFLSRYHLRILLMEKEPEICMGTSGANSATIHSGHSVQSGTLKAEMNLKGSAMWDTLSGELQIPFERRGDYVIAIGEEELPALDILISQGRANGVLGLSIISGDEMRKREPNINSLTRGALWSRNSSLCDPWIATIATAENAVANGVTIKLNTRFDDFIMESRRIVGVKSNHGIFGCRWVINAGGVYADEIMHRAGVHPEFKITPRRGEFFLLDGRYVTLNNLLSPVPSKVSKGIAVKPTADGNVLAGSNAQDIENKEDLAVTPEGLTEVWAGACKLIPSLNYQYTLAVFAGLRASGNAPSKNKLAKYNADFIVELAEEVDGLINLAGIESPGLTAAPAIAIQVIELLQEAGEKLTEKSGWNPIRLARIRTNNLSVEERAELLKKARYQKVPSWLWSALRQ
ncbi:MAG: NAD(P)/FAD-dependent oxidoreductase [Chloroflexi bacterium]|nr:NAD(P)/FAD-dependent oxidoreductase [Chloroflexota bacterium]